MNSFGLFVSVFSQLIWGTCPVLARYIGTRVAGKPSTVAVLGCLAAFDTSVLLLIAALRRCTFGYALAADRTSLAAIAAMGPDSWRCFFGYSSGWPWASTSATSSATRRK